MRDSRRRYRSTSTSLPTDFRPNKFGSGLFALSSTTHYANMERVQFQQEQVRPNVILLFNNN